MLEPGPGAYDPKLPPTIEWTMRGAREVASRLADKSLPIYGLESPGPAAYGATYGPQIEGIKPDGHGRIAHHPVKNTVEVRRRVARVRPSASV